MNKLKGLYVITDEVLTPDENVIKMVEKALESGAKIIQYRNKTKKDEEIKFICKELKSLCFLHNALFIIDDRVELAKEVMADGVHIGKDDISIKEAKDKFNGIIGVSCYGSIKKALEAQDEGASYVAFGSFYHSPTKPHSGIVPLRVLKEAKEALDIPICAIGGISEENIEEIASYNPDMISVVSAVFKDENIEKNTLNLRSKI